MIIAIFVTFIVIIITISIIIIVIIISVIIAILIIIIIFYDLNFIFIFIAFNTPPRIPMHPKCFIASSPRMEMVLQCLWMIC